MHELDRTPPGVSSDGLNGAFLPGPVMGEKALGGTAEAVAQREREDAAAGASGCPLIPEGGEEETALGVLMEFIPDGLILVDMPDLRVRMVSEYVARLTGIAREEIKGFPLERLLRRMNLRRPGAGEPAPLEELPVMRAVRFGEKVAGEEWTFSHGNGEEYTLLISAEPIRDKTGAISGGITSWWDATGRVNAEKALRESEERYRLLSDTISDYVFSFRVDPGPVLKAEWMTPGFQRITGYTPEEAKDMDNMRGFTFPDDVGILMNAIRELLSGQKDLDFEYRIIARNGELHWLHVYARSIQNAPDGRIVRIYGAVQDITARKQAEESLRKSEESWRNFIETAEEGVWVLDERDRTTFFNGKLAGMFGFTVEEMQGRSAFDFVDSEWRPVLERNLELRRRGHRGQYEIKFCRRDGSDLWALVSASPVVDENGNYRGSFAMITDISERKRSEEELRTARDELEERVWRRTVDLEQAIEGLRTEIAERKRTGEELRRQKEIQQTVVDNIPIMLIFFDPEGRLQWLNQEFERRMGWSTGEARATDFQAELYPDPEYRREILDFMMSANRGWRDINVCPRAGGTVESSWTSIRLSDGSLIAIGIDITERRRMEATLHKREREFEALVENAPDIIARFDRDLRLSYVNHAVEHRLGIPVAEITMKTLPELGIPEDLTNRLLAKLRSVFDTGGEETIETGFLLAEGWKWYYSRMAPVSAQDGAVDAVLCISHDITELKKAEEELRLHREHLEELVEERTTELEHSNLLLQQEIAERRQAERNIQELNESLRRQTVQLLASNKELEAFSYSVSHDLRTPLRSIDGFSQALLEDYSDVLDDQGKDFLQRIRASTQRMGRLIDDLINLARVARSEMLHVRVNLSALAVEIMAELRKTRRDRKVDVVIQKDMIVDGDAGLLRQALENLLGNAWKFTERTPNAKIEFGAMDEDGQRVFFVRDNGAGFDMQYVDKLFLPFQRLHSREDFAGTGIGLAIVRRVVQRHGGKIWAVGAPDKGAAFYFTLQQEDSREHGYQKHPAGGG